MEQTFFLYDSRYHDSPERATVYSVSETLQEAREDREDFPDGVIVQYDTENGEIFNPRIIN